MIGLTSPPKVSLVTVTYNAQADLPEFFQCYSQLSGENISLIVVDNASEDPTAEIVRQAQASLTNCTFIQNTRNTGVAAANNQGIKFALSEGADWIVLINNDVSFGRDLIKNLTNNPKEKITSPLIPYYSEPEKIWFSTGKFSALKGFTGTHINKDQSVDVLSFGDKQYSEYAPTCCMAIQSEVFSVVGLMDESYFVYFDDTDFCWRLRNAGYRIRLVGDSLLFHKVGASTGGVDSAFTVKFTSRNRIFFLKKNIGFISALLFLPVFIGYYAYKYIFKSWVPELFRLSLHGLCLGLFMSTENSGD